VSDPQKSCKTCRYFCENPEPHIGTCGFHSPIRNPDEPEMQRFPLVWSFEFCAWHRWKDGEKPDPKPPE
jgi:hypothetical protein